MWFMTIIHDHKAGCPLTIAWTCNSLKSHAKALKRLGAPASAIQRCGTGNGKGPERQAPALPCICLLATK